MADVLSLVERRRLNELDALLEELATEVAVSSRRKAAETEVASVDAATGERVPVWSSVPARVAVLTEQGEARTTQKGPLLAALGAVVAVVGDFVLNLSQGLWFESYVIAWSAVATSVWVLFDRTEAAVSEEVRAKASAWILDADFSSAIRAMPAQFIVGFERIFGSRHLSWRCFYRSSFASLVAVLAGVATWVGVTPAASDALREPEAMIALLWLVVFSGVFNFIPDYLSLLQTRWVLGVMEKSGRIGRYLLLDLVLTSAISASLIFVTVRYVYSPTLPPGSFWWSWLDLVRVSDYYGDIGFVVQWSDPLGGGALHLPLGIFYYSAFFTSVWVWLYVAVLVVVWAAGRLSGVLRFLLRVTDVERHPFRSMGYVAVLIVTLCFLIGFPGFALWK